MYDKLIEIPARTTKENSKVNYLHICTGIIHDVHVIFFDGPHLNAHCRILQGGDQIYPANKSGDFCSNKEEIKFKTYRSIKEGETVLTIKTWNTGKFNHSIIVRIGVMQEWQLNAYKMLEKLYNLMINVGQMIGLRGDRFG